MYRKQKYKTSTATKHELRTSAFEPLDAEQSQLRSQLIERVGNAFYVSGIALLQLKEERLYRSTHFSFDEFCQDVFGAACVAGKRRAYATWAHTPCLAIMLI